MRRDALKKEIKRRSREGGGKRRTDGGGDGRSDPQRDDDEWAEVISALKQAPHSVTPNSV